MAIQVGKGRPVTKPAAGDARNTGAPGPTPAPVREYDPREKDRTMGRESYGSNAWSGASSLTPNQKASSPLADALKAKNAEGDGGDLLQHIIEKGVARNNDDLISSQLRTVSKDQYPTTFGLAKRGSDSGSPGGVVPSATGHSPYSDELRRRQAALQRASGDDGVA